MKKVISILVIFLLATSLIQAKDYKVVSPDGKLVLVVKAGPGLEWSATYEGKEIISSVKAGLELPGKNLPDAADVVRKSLPGTINQVIEPEVAYKRSRITDNCNTLLITFKSGLSVQFRAYNDGVAYRFETAFKDALTIRNELTGISFPKGSVSWYPREDSFMSHNERLFLYSSLDTITEKHLASLPALFKANGVNVLITESDIEDYPGMWIRGAGNGNLKGIHPAYPDTEKARNDRDVAVVTTKDYIAKTAGTRTFPWRVFIVAPTDGQLVENDLVYRLAAPCRLTDTKWIKPGKVAWDWWNANNIYGVDFKSGVNNDTYKYYIDFAAKNGIDYVILDEGWYKLGDVTQQVPAINVEELVKYGQDKHVGIILWVVWKGLWDKMDEALALYEKWGVKGVKVDFMQRDDQKVVNFYWEAARKSAEHHMLIDFHGAYKPDGLGRTYPNALTREGVKGMENDKWSKDITPAHDVTLAYTRMVAGPMDYTPGAMVNMERNNFNPVFTRPSSQGTRVHQMALYVIFESPLQMLADSPSNYMKEQECTDFIAKVPVVWDDIKVLSGETGKYLLLARRSGNNWFVGGLTDWGKRELDLDLSFLPSGNYTAEIFSDGVNADKYAQDYKHVKMDIKSGDKMKITLAPGGGWAAKISPR